jgi:hypothetical protein
MTITPNSLFIVSFVLGGAKIVNDVLRDDIRMVEPFIGAAE